MIEYHGFIVIREGYQESMNNDILLNDIIITLKNKIDFYNKQYQNADIVLNHKNDIYQLSVFGGTNHLNQDWLDFYELLKWIAKNAVGSYGVIYFLDNDNCENFWVYCLKKGEIYCEKDDYFSPINPQIELF